MAKTGPNGKVVSLHEGWLCHLLITNLLSGHGAAGFPNGFGSRLDTSVFEVDVGVAVTENVAGDSEGQKAKRVFRYLEERFGHMR